MITHPLPVGTRLRSLGGAAQGDWDEDDDGTERRAKPGETARITSAEKGRDGWIYGVEFDECEAWIFLEQHEIEDPAKYELLAG